MMRTLNIVGATLIAGMWLVLPSAAFAQIKPHTSGHSSYHAPVMRMHGSGFKYPNKPHSHRFHHSYRHHHRLFR